MQRGSNIFKSLHVCPGSSSVCRLGFEQRRNSSPWNSSLQEIRVGNQRQSPFLSTGTHTAAGGLDLRYRGIYIYVHLYISLSNIIIHWKTECNKTAYTDRLAVHLFLSDLNKTEQESHSVSWQNTSSLCVWDLSSCKETSSCLLHFLLVSSRHQHVRIIYFWIFFPPSAVDFLVPLCKMLCRHPIKMN